MAFAPGKSGNSAGRPRRTALTDTANALALYKPRAQAALAKAAPDILERAITLAKAGDPTILPVLLKLIFAGADRPKGGASAVASVRLVIEGGAPSGETFDGAVIDVQENDT